MKIEIRGPSKDGQFWWRIVASNGKVLLTSEMYTRKAGAMRAARKFAWVTFLAGVEDDGIVDRTK